MAEQSAVFQEIYDDYLRQVGALDLPALAGRLGGRMVGDELELAFFGQPHRLSGKGVRDPEGRRPIHSVSVILCKYAIIGGESQRGEIQWTPYKGFPDAAPFVPGFDDTVHKIIANAFADDAAGLAAAAAAFGGVDPGLGLGYDVARQFHALPKMPMLMLFNGAEDGFPAHCSVLFAQDATSYLDVECIAICGMVLAAWLREQGKKQR
ncbi:conserved hypothetical protein [Desulfarculus baarsii DSM 2075]|uniref:DUF3786 domain-containing protein n=1 Tax=Desulfarculus baarsii (strain ATCC 33931 / DSM 2075 / LMG 7858 / VKM B-1802 / 2st14) TaxID=644282 RepID=E1QLE6_DESB2|nr:DUF3786 domain-containing protein [Desulfarculus baarsii]ADK86381.1 conserved hypothetical protein [Desulfarculus baarsii DSM 2075]